MGQADRSTLRYSPIGLPGESRPLAFWLAITRLDMVVRCFPHVARQGIVTLAMGYFTNFPPMAPPTAVLLWVSRRGKRPFVRGLEKNPSLPVPLMSPWRA